MQESLQEQFSNKILTGKNDNILTETSNKSCLDATSEKEFNENNVAADNPNGLASLVTQEIHSDS